MFAGNVILKKMFKASKYDKLYPDRDMEIRFLLKYLRGKTVLDIGGGTGFISQALNSEGFMCWSVEPQKEMVEISRQKGVDTVCSTAEKMELDIGFDNAIMMFNVFNFLEDPDKALNNISKLLKGRLIFTYYNQSKKVKGWQFNWKLKRLSRKKWFGNRVEIDFWFPFWHEHHTMRVYSDKHILKLLKKHGFKIVKRIKEKYTTNIVAKNAN